MCYNKESSITAYAVGMILSYYLYQGDKNYKTIALFSFTFIQIQLAEFLMWIDQDCRKGYNKFGTIFSELVLYLQPASILFALLLFDTSIISDSNLKLALIICLIPVYKVLLKNIKNKRNLCSRPSINTSNLNWDYPSPKWEKSNVIIYFLFLFGSWFLFKDKIKSSLVILTLVITFYSSKLNFYQWESRWCILGTLLPFIFSLMKFITQLNNQKLK